MSIFIISDEKRLTWKERQPPGIGQSQRNIVRYVRNVRREIGLPKGNRLRYRVRWAERKSEKQSEIKNNSEFHRIRLLLRAKTFVSALPSKILVLNPKLFLPGSWGKNRLTQWPTSSVCWVTRGLRLYAWATTASVGSGSACNSRRRRLRAL